MSEEGLRMGISKILVKWSMPTRQVAILELLSLFKETMERVIGEDEDEGFSRIWGYKTVKIEQVKNLMRKEQRKALLKEIGEE